MKKWCRLSSGTSKPATSDGAPFKWQHVVFLFLIKYYYLRSIYQDQPSAMTPAHWQTNKEATNSMPAQSGQWSLNFCYLLSVCHVWQCFPAVMCCLKLELELTIEDIWWILVEILYERLVEKMTKIGKANYRMGPWVNLYFLVRARLTKGVMIRCHKSKFWSELCTDDCSNWK